MTSLSDDGIVVRGESGGKGVFPMDIADVPEALVERLGNEAAQGLATLLDRTRTEWMDEVLTTAVDRFDSRLTTEVSMLRIDFTREISLYRQEMTRDLATLRQDVTKEISTVRVEILKWSFLFWVGQVAAMAGLLAFMLKT